VTILIRVFDMDGQATVHMFVDIWECYMRGRLRLMAVDGFRAQIQA
jgi:protocatechuate 3,4-dioxygenase beta subunit